MASFNTAIIDGDTDVVNRLADWGLCLDQFRTVARIARDREADASPLMPLNAPGTLAYIYGVEALRRELLDEEWEIDRVNGVEVVVNRIYGIRIGFHNVDRACDRLFPPRPRSAKGKAAERMSGPTFWEYYGMEPGPLTGVGDDGIATYYLMVAEDGGAELSQPVIENGCYVDFHERIFVNAPKEEWEEEIDLDTGPIDGFDIPVTFKTDV